MRLIDADAFKEYICNALEQTRQCYPDGGRWAEAITEQFCLDIDEQPTIQPAQPNTGKWISADAIFGGIPFYCSECGENTRNTVMGKPRWNFCPMCGAKMGVTE